LSENKTHTNKTDIPYLQLVATAVANVLLDIYCL